MKACEGVDYIMHEAAWGSVPRSIEMPVFYCMNNIVGFVNMCEAARQNKVKKFVYASSSSVYGDEPVLPKKEGREGNLLSPYALSKRADEEWAKQYTRHYGLDTYGLRYFNVFGRRQDPDGAYAAVGSDFAVTFLLAVCSAVLIVALEVACAVFTPLSAVLTEPFAVDFTAFSAFRAVVLMVFLLC